MSFLLLHEEGGFPPSRSMHISQRSRSISAITLAGVLLGPVLALVKTLGAVVDRVARVCRCICGGSSKKARILQGPVEVFLILYHAPAPVSQTTTPRTKCLLLAGEADGIRIMSTLGVKVRAANGEWGAPSPRYVRVTTRIMLHDTSHLVLDLHGDMSVWKRVKICDRGYRSDRYVQEARRPWKDNNTEYTYLHVF